MKGRTDLLTRRDRCATTVPADGIERRILLVRGEKVMLDADLAVLYGVDTRSLNQAVARNPERFPPDFMFRLTPTEHASMTSQSVISSRRRRSRAPLVFTEHGVSMLSSVLRSPRAVQVNIEIMRAFARLRSILGSHAQLARKIAALERKCNGRFRVVFEALRALVAVSEKPRRPIGFRNGSSGEGPSRA
jgi:hypothetical protein